MYTNPILIAKAQTIRLYDSLTTFQFILHTSARVTIKKLLCHFPIVNYLMATYSHQDKIPN